MKTWCLQPSKAHSCHIRDKSNQLFRGVLKKTEICMASYNTKHACFYLSTIMIVRLRLWFGEITRFYFNSFIYSRAYTIFTIIFILRYFMYCVEIEILLVVMWVEKLHSKLNTENAGPKSGKTFASLLILL